MLTCCLCHAATLAEERVESCSECGAIYHVDCFDENGGCGTYGCSRVPQEAKQAAAGHSVTVNVHSRPVVRIVPFKAAMTLASIAQLPGVRWNGAKPAGLPQGEPMRKGVSLSAWVKQGRR